MIHEERGKCSLSNNKLNVAIPSPNALSENGSICTARSEESELHPHLINETSRAAAPTTDYIKLVKASDKYLRSPSCISNVIEVLSVDSDEYQGIG